MDDNDAYLWPETRTRLQPVDRRCGDGVESARDTERGVVPQSRSGSRSREDYSCPNEPDIVSEYREDKTRGSLQLGDRDKSDDVSETSMVDSISGLDISPDDVVGILGQKHFWKARKAIVKEIDNSNRGMQGDPRDIGSSIFLCCLASAYRIYSCLRLVLLFFPAIPGGYLFTAHESVE